MNNNNNPFDDGVEEYENWFKENDQLLSSELDAIRPFIPASGNGIEIGVGTGLFASNLGIGTGLEPSERMAAIAVSRGVNVIQGDAEKIPLPDSSYQFALMVTVDCFLNDVPKAFSEVRRILSKNGTVIIALLDLGTPLGNFYEMNKHKSKSYKNANFHTAEYISKLLEIKGFIVIGQKQTIFTLENKYQPPRDGVGEGLFAVIKAQKKI